MEKKYKITIPEPCHEDWNEMTPNDNGRYCINCAKTVVDFTRMLPEEVQHFFAQNQNKSICGRIRTSQLDSITIQIPHRVLYSQTQYHKMFLLALFIAMGTTLFSCADKNGAKQKINKVEVIEDDSEKNNITGGETLPSKHNYNTTVLQPSQAPLHKYPVKFVKQKKQDVLIAGATMGELAAPIIYEDSIIYGGMGIDVYPDYIGGIEEFTSYFKNNYTIPQKARKLNGKMEASFVIEKDGTLNDIVIIKDLGFGTGDELIRVLKQSKKWTPAEVQGKKNRFHYESEIFITTDTVRKIFNLKKVTSRIDTIQIKRITKFND